MHKSMNNFSTWLTVVMLVIFTTMVLIATGYPAGARFMPFVVGIPGILLCLLQLAEDYMASHRSRLAAHFESAPRAGQHKLKEFPTAEETSELEVKEPEWGPHTVRAEIRVWTYFVSFMVGVLLFGFVLSVPVLVAVYLWRDAEVRRPYAIVAGLVCGTVMHLMFESLLQFQLHQGFVTEYVLRAVGF